MPPVLLTIAGSDSGGGAGIQADLRTAYAFGMHGCSVVTAVTAQNPKGVTAVEAVAPALVAAQLETVLAGFHVAAIKTGLLPNAETIRRIAAVLPGKPPLVIDPVLASTSGKRFLDARGVRALREALVPLARLVTPNWPEAAELAGVPVGNDEQAAAVARRLAREFRCAVLVKGGHGTGGWIVDFLAGPRGELTRFRHRRIETPNTHGTGCVLSAAIAAGLGAGQTLEEAIGAATRLLARELRNGRSHDWGGRGPAAGPWRRS